MDKKNLIVIVLMAVIIIIGTVFLVLKQKSAVPQDEISQVREHADVMTENILLGLDEGDYSKFSKDFNAQVKEGMSESVFPEVESIIKNTVGDYLFSKEFIKELKSEQHFSFYYKAQFSKEPDGVTVKLVLEKSNGEIKIAGLWFDSPKLREL
jgi:hypothetical protein